MRKDLEQVGHVGWRGHSDTEVFLAAVDRYGVERTLPLLAGMYAFAIWDSQERRLDLVRDRMGEKPLYYGWIDGDFVFASELKAFQAHPGWTGELDLGALTQFCRFGCVPSPRSIFRSVHKLPAAHWMSVRCGHPNPAPVPYWSAVEVAERGPPFAGADVEAVDALDELLRSVVSEQMIADVPLGVFLSGGIDSSIVAALMQSQSKRPIRTFTIGFGEAGYNEAGEAKLVAEHLGSHHHEQYVSPEDALAVIPQLPTMYDEPFADASQLPTHLVAKMAREHVTVCLSGDGGDELFGGYNRYRWAEEIWKRVGGLPTGGRSVFARGLTAISPGGWDRVAHLLGPVTPRALKVHLPGDKIFKLADVVRARSQEDMYLRLTSLWNDPERMVLGGSEPPSPFDSIEVQGSLRQRMMMWDLLTYLPNDILTKVDRATMSVSLESRAPLLDSRVAEFALRLPLALKIRNGETKWLLRQVLYRYLPRALVDRPKMGFGVPVGAWLRGPLKDWAEDLLDEHLLCQEGIFSAPLVREKWGEHQSGRRNWQYQLWAVLMFQAWYRNQRHCAVEIAAA